MAIQNRPDGLIFADQAKTGEVLNFPDITRGWGVSFEQTEGKPPMEWMNGILRRQDQAIKYLLQQGISEWSAAEDYPVGSLVKYQQQIWLALQNNKDAIPQKDSTYWSDNPFSQYLLKSNINNDIQTALIGIPMPYPLAIAPTGWIAMQGQAFDADTYPILAQRYPAHMLPDLRGEFIRGWDNGRAIDEGRNLLSLQQDAIRNITGVVTQVDDVAGRDHVASGAFKSVYNHSWGWAQVAGGTGYLVDFDASRMVPTASENRPRNIAFNYICMVG